MARYWRMLTSTRRKRQRSTTACGSTRRGPASLTAQIRWSCRRRESARRHCSTSWRFSARSLEERWHCTRVSWVISLCEWSAFCLSWWNELFALLVATSLHTHTTVLRPFFKTTRKSQCQKKSSGLHGAREDNRGRHTDNPDGLHSIRTNQWPTSIPHFYTRCSSCRNPPNLCWLGTGTKYAGLHTQWLGYKLTVSCKLCTTSSISLSLAPALKWFYMLLFHLRSYIYSSYELLVDLAASHKNSLKTCQWKRVDIVACCAVISGGFVVNTDSTDQ